MKEPEEIKKGLVEAIEDASCVVEYGDAHDLIDAVEKDRAIMADALAYIQQIERDKAWTGENYDLMREELAQVQRERDALVSDARGRCFSCRHSGVLESDEPCRTCLFETEGCISVKPAWEWRGVQEKEAGNDV